MASRLSGGKIVEEFTHWDNFGMLQQLGTIPALAARLEKPSRSGEWTRREDARAALVRRSLFRKASIVWWGYPDQLRST